MGNVKKMLSPKGLWESTKSSYGDPTLFALKESKRHYDVMSEVPKAPEVEPLITEDSLAITEAATREAERLRKKKGLKSTMTTGPQGVTGEAPTMKATLA